MLRNRQDFIGICCSFCLAVADYFTSDYRQHHIIDPRTGHSPTELASATVLAPTALAADALGTALLVMDSTAGLDLAERLPGVAALLVTKDLRVLQSSGMVVN